MLPGGRDRLSVRSRMNLVDPVSRGDSLPVLELKKRNEAGIDLLDRYSEARQTVRSRSVLGSGGERPGHERQSEMHASLTDNPHSEHAAGAIPKVTPKYFSGRSINVCA